MLGTAIIHTTEEGQQMAWEVREGLMDEVTSILGITDGLGLGKQRGRECSYNFQENK